MDDDLTAVGRYAGSVGAEDDGDLFLRDPDATKAEQIVMVDRRRANVDDLPSLGSGRLGDLADLEARRVGRQA